MIIIDNDLLMYIVDNVIMIKVLICLCVCVFASKLQRSHIFLPNISNWLWLYNVHKCGISMKMKQKYPCVFYLCLFSSPYKYTILLNDNDDEFFYHYFILNDEKIKQIEFK